MSAPVLRRIERLNYILGGVFIVVSAIYWTQAHSLGVLVGVVLSALNFSVVRRIVERWMKRAQKGDHTAGLYLAPKMGFLILLVFLAIRFLPISGVGFVVGFSVFLLSIAIETIRTATTASNEANGESH